MNFFVKNNSGGPVNFQMGESCDPFTGGNAYVSGSGGSRASSFTNNGASDPFTGEKNDFPFTKYLGADHGSGV